METNILFSCSSVGLSHLYRNLRLLEEFHNNPDYEIDLLVPDPICNHDLLKNYNVLIESYELKSSGQLYNELFSKENEKYDLTNFIRHDSLYHKHDCEITRKVLERKKYSFVVSDEAFWYLSGLTMGWINKDFVFIYSTEFIAMINMTKDKRLDNFYRIKNLEFLRAAMAIDHFLFYGKILDIPNEPFGRNLPNQRDWALKNCTFVYPDMLQVINENDNLEKVINNNKTFLLIAYSPSKAFNHKLYTIAKETFFKIDYENPNKNTFLFYTDIENINLPDNFIQIQPGNNLMELIKKSDFVISQAGLLKLIEIIDLKKRAILIPHDYHFEQEFWIKRRLKFTSGINHCLLRELNPDKLYKIIQELEESEIYDPFHELFKSNSTSIKKIIKYYKTEEENLLIASS